MQCTITSAWPWLPPPPAWGLTASTWAYPPNFLDFDFVLTFVLARHKLENEEDQQRHPPHGHSPQSRRQATRGWLAAGKFRGSPASPRTKTRNIDGEIPARGQCVWQMRCADGLESPAILPVDAANLPLLYFSKLKTSSNVGECSK